MAATAAYHLITLFRLRSSGTSWLRGAGPTMAWLILFALWAVMEYFFLLYYEKMGFPFTILPPRLILDVDLWFYAFITLLLSSAFIVTISFYLMEFKVLYLLPPMGVAFGFYLVYLIYRLYGITLFTYLEINEILSSTIALTISMFLIFGFIAIILFLYIYMRTKSMRALSFAIASFIMGLLLLGIDYTLSILPLALTRQILPWRGEFLKMLVDWPLNVIYIIAALLMFLGQIRVLDAIFKPSAKKEAPWIEKMMEKS
jgi:hypothetical protein